MKRILIFTLPLLLLVSCGKKEESSEFVEEHPKVEEPEKKPDTTVNKVTIPPEEKKTESEKPITDKSSKTDIVISPLDAKDWIGKSVNVKGYVADVHKNDKVAYLNFVEKFPDNPFSAVVFSNKFDEFGDLDKYLNKTVIVGGRVTTYKDKPQIILENKSQVKIVK